MKAAIVGIAGAELAAEEARLFAAHPPAGVILFRRNIETPGQLAGLVAALRRVLRPGAVLMLDQEGGRVARLRPPHWRAHPPMAAIGALHAADPAGGPRAAFLTGALIGADLAAAGFDVDCAPVLDVRDPEGHDVVGDRAFADDPRAVARLGRAFAAGLLAAGIQPVMKHAPGHGRARADSHRELPRVAANDLGRDMLPFAANMDMPWAMTAHILYTGLDPDRPASLSARVIRGILRGQMGFSGVLVSDDLDMGALSGPPEGRARAALEAGSDIALFCPGRLAETRAVLEACPELTAPARRRLAAARALAAARRVALDPARLAGERARLLARADGG